MEGRKKRTLVEARCLKRNHDYALVVSLRVADPTIADNTVSMIGQE